MSADDESFHPLGSEWEGQMEEMLEDTEYDTDLGMEMAKDAMAVTKGDLSEAEFHEKYHDDVMAEFGEDERPTQEAYEEAKAVEEGTFSRMLEKFDGDGEEDRRNVMKKMGAGAAFLGLGAWATVDEPDADPEPSIAAAQEEDDDDGLQWGMTIDLERCDGCLSCVTACADENQLDSGVNWMYVLEFDDPDNEEGTESSLARAAGPAANRLVRPCQHCTDAPCEKVCPTTARHTRDYDGLVLTDYDVCIGCRYCQVACPYGVNYFQWDEPSVSTDDIADHYEEMGMGDHMTDDRGRWVDSRAPRGVMSKCTMCPTRQDEHMGADFRGTTACMDACPPDAIQFGNVNDDLSDPTKYRRNPSRGRTLSALSMPSPDTLEEDLGDADADLESVLEATEELDEETLALMLAVEMTGEHMGEAPEDEQSMIAEYEQEVLDALEVLEDHGLDLEDEEFLAELDLDGGESDAQIVLERFAGAPSSSYQLLEDIGTNPNIQYLGNEPGPRAEQREPTGTGASYEQISYTTVSGEDIDLADNRKDVLDEGTVGWTGGSL
ncbi:4Fe-4S ferredoxin N-terminal domain-containing protein [Natrarchaeobaculum aegyptiacum]|uniref:4Fe-4S ferredoxin n=1 Tax=Natrarchaeobaculum aegyptiacum TaxID=745377 RepID=A0A2Z2HTH4_9EURY|nr:4Fe-4S ferredoxin N-terminal domain-containing protein [Natrarchaeobaculum aegyptiacum]ARS88364.1 4Fe-4S ferredoxin [Natrarchaeobaculum aegyptiacum]